MGHDRLTRRDLLKTGAGAATFAATMDLLTPRRTLAARDHKLVFWLQPNFNPTADKVLEEQTMAFAKEAGLKDSEVQILKVSGGELAPKLTAALEINAPPDVTRLSEAFVARHRALGQLLDISDLMAEMRKVEGGLVPAVIPLTEAGGRFYAVPMGLSPLIFTARTDLFEKAGYSTFPDTWEKLLAHQGHVREAPGHPAGRGELGQRGQQQGVPVPAGRLRVRRDQHLFLSPDVGYRAGLADRTLRGARGPRRPCAASLHGLLRRVQGEPVPGSG